MFMMYSFSHAQMDQDAVQDARLGLLILSVAASTFVLVFSCVILSYIIRYRRKFKFPCSLCERYQVVCTPYCYCVGLYVESGTNGFIGIAPCDDCYYSLCGCTQPPPELVGVRRFSQNPIGGTPLLPINSHSTVMSIISRAEYAQPPNN